VPPASATTRMRLRLTFAMSLFGLVWMAVAAEMCSFSALGAEMADGSLPVVDALASLDESAGVVSALTVFDDASDQRSG
jgi:hypothetical protein